MTIGTISLSRDNFTQSLTIGEFMLEGTKSKLASKGVLGGLIALIPVLDQALVFTGVLPVPVLGEAVSILTAAFGSLFGIYGRIIATKKLH